MGRHTIVSAISFNKGSVLHNFVLYSERDFYTQLKHIHLANQYLQLQAIALQEHMTSNTLLFVSHQQFTCEK